MQIMMATSRSISKDRVYQSEQSKKHELHLLKIKTISQSPLQPIKVDTTFQKQLKKAKSLAKIFEKEETKIVHRLENRSLLNRIINIQPSIKTVRIKSTQLKERLTTTASNWTTRKKQNQKMEKQHQVFIKRCDSISNVNVKDVKKKIQEEIQEYLQLRNSIRKIKLTNSTSQSAKKLRSASSKKISMALPLWSDNNQNPKLSENQQEAVAQGLSKQSSEKIASKTEKIT